ncbi:DUF4753 domain-containing protein [Kluyvera genomosp. 3]|uniref:DUF4753 domain-containing protein n=1 Tax=Kluyvera genomosp. 3 TaxID=2774055 RepID=A0A248KKZ2_9ENTR|nr:DUF4753 domain-containing protein [Kluyvera genomosp. 3]
MGSLKQYGSKNRQNFNLKTSVLFGSLCRYFMLYGGLFFVYLWQKSEYYLSLID